MGKETAVLVKDAASREAERALVVMRADASSIPVDPWEVARNAGFSVVAAPLRRGVASFVVKLEGVPARIYVNSCRPLVSQRFSLAHSIGHCYERATIAKDGAYTFQDPCDYDLHEYYADVFACSLLMPLDLLPVDWGIEKDLSAVAARFGVPVDAVALCARLRLGGKGAGE